MITYMTLPGDTLEKIASDLKVENPIYLKEFHNKHCALQNRLVEPIHLKTGTLLHIPFGEEIKKLNQEINDNGDSLYYHPPHGKIAFEIPLLEGTYDISHRKERNFTLLAEYQYQLELQYIRSEHEEYYFKFKMFDFKKNHIESDTKMAELAKMCTDIIYPLEIKINETNGLVDFNFQNSISDIRERLEDIKKHMTDQYANFYIENFKSIIDNKKQFLESLKNILPIHFFLNSFYRSQYDDWTDSKPYKESFPWIGNASPIMFDFYNQIQLKNDNNALKIIQKGTTCDYRRLDELLILTEKYNKEAAVHENSITCQHIAEYNLNPSDFSIQKIKGYFTLYIDDDTEEDIIIIKRK